MHGKPYCMIPNPNQYSASWLTCRVFRAWLMPPVRFSCFCWESRAVFSANFPPNQRWTTIFRTCRWRSTTDYFSIFFPAANTGHSSGYIGVFSSFTHTHVISMRVFRFSVVFFFFSRRTLECYSFSRTQKVGGLHMDNFYLPTIRIGLAGISDKWLYWPIEGRWQQVVVVVVFRSMNSVDSWWWSVSSSQRNVSYSSFIYLSEGFFTAQPPEF